MLALTSPVLLFPLLTGKIVSKGFSANSILVISLLCFASGLIILWAFNQHSSFFLQVIIPLFLVGTGMGLSAGLVDGLALSIVSEEEVGRAAGILNTFRLGSEAIAVAIYGALMTHEIQNGLTNKILNSEEAIKKITSNLISGNVPKHVSSSVARTFSQIYQSSFSHTVIVLFIISAILSTAIIMLIKLNKFTSGGDTYP